MPAAVGGPQREVGRDLLRRLHRVEQVLALAQRPAAPFVDDHGGINQLAVVLRQPIHAVERPALLIGGEGDDDVAVRDVAFLLHPEDVGHEDRRHRLVVGGPASVVVARAP
jgi:hypothetical protein